AACGKKSCLVHEVGQVGAGETRRAACQDKGVHVGGQRHLAHVDFQDLFAAADIGQGHDHLAVEAAWTQQGRIKDIGPVGGSNDQHALASFKAVHFDQQLVKRLFTFVVAAAQAGTTLTADGVDFIDENNA